VFSWGPTALVAANPGHTIRYAVDPGSTLRWGGATDRLAELHFHARSEHTANGAHLEAELHFEHVDLADPNRALVVAAFVVRTDDPIPDPVFGAEGALRFRAALALPEGAAPAPLGGDIDLGEVFAGITTAGSVGYDGSLSTPPCTEGVPTFISDFSVVMAADDLDALLDVYDFNYRPTQPLNGRALSYYPAGGAG
jgi:carbonic anhydrase